MRGTIIGLDDELHVPPHVVCENNRKSLVD